MGAIADAIAAFAKPLLDQTDGSIEQLNEAFMIAQLCYNLAIFPRDSRDEMLGEMQGQLGMDDEEFEDFRRSVVEPMIRRHEEMFPQMHGRPATPALRRGREAAAFPRAPAHSIPTVSAQRPAVVDRYAPCPCGSGKKYKFCCESKRH